MTQRPLLMNTFIFVVSFERVRGYLSPLPFESLHFTIAYTSSTQQWIMHLFMNSTESELHFGVDKYFPRAPSMRWSSRKLAMSLVGNKYVHALRFFSKGKRFDARLQFNAFDDLIKFDKVWRTIQCLILQLSSSWTSKQIWWWRHDEKVYLIGLRVEVRVSQLLTQWQLLTYRSDSQASVLLCCKRRKTPKSNPR